VATGLYHPLEAGAVGFWRSAADRLDDRTCVFIVFTETAPDVTFDDRYTLEVGGDRVELAWHGPNHSPDNIFINFPDHDTLMLIDIVNSGWVPMYNLNLSEDVPGYIQAPATALSYPWKTYIGGPECWPLRTSRSSSGPPRSRSCSPSDSTRAPAHTDPPMTRSRRLGCHGGHS